MFPLTDADYEKLRTEVATASLAALKDLEEISQLQEKIVEGENGHSERLEILLDRVKEAPRFIVRTLTGASQTYRRVSLSQLKKIVSKWLGTLPYFVKLVNTDGHDVQHSFDTFTLIKGPIYLAALNTESVEIQSLRNAPRRLWQDVLSHGVNEGDERVIEFVTRLPENVIEEGQSWLLFFAAEVGWSTLISQLPRVNLEHTDHFRCTPLHRASHYGHCNVAEALLEKKSCVDSRTFDGYTPLITASFRDNLDLVRLLINHQAEINTQSNSGITALYGASRGNQTHILEFLLQSNADIHSSPLHASPLLEACRCASPMLVEKLIQNNANVNVKDAEGFFPLFVGALTARSEVVEILLNGNAAVNTQCKLGRSALYMASFHGHMDIVRLLLDYEADVTIKTQNMVSPLGASLEGFSSLATRLMTQTHTSQLVHGNSRSQKLQNIRSVISQLLEAGALLDASVQINYQEFCQISQQFHFHPDSTDDRTSLMTYCLQEHAKIIQCMQPLLKKEMVLQDKNEDGTVVLQEIKEECEELESTEETAETLDD